MTAFAKEFACAAAAAEAVRRSGELRRQGLRTPRARVCGRTAVFDHIVGDTGLALASSPVQPWLEALAVLHGCSLENVPTWDPLRRIRPRLSLLDVPNLGDALDLLSGTIPDGAALLHGDFHLGQLISDSDASIWMVDLDDLCIGPPEADLGNLIANLATQHSLPGDFETRIGDWRDRVRDAWEQTVGPLREPVLDHSLALSLLRRHLKLREAGRPDFGEEIAAWIIPVADRISPSGSAGYRG